MSYYREKCNVELCVDDYFEIYRTFIEALERNFEGNVHLVRTC